MYRPAFSLIELSIVLIISGLLIASLVPKIQKIEQEQKIKTQIEMIKKSLGAYAVINGHLPEPHLAEEKTEGVLEGFAPYASLGLDAKDFLPFAYIVDKRLTKTHLIGSETGLLRTEIENFCNTTLHNVLPYPTTNSLPPKDIVAFLLTYKTTKKYMTRNNFAAIYCNNVCAVRIGNPETYRQRVLPYGRVED